MARAFSDLGEGIVMRGHPFKWTSLKGPHLTTELAEDSMMRVCAEYARHLGHRPNRVVVHMGSRYWDEERTGFDTALAGVSNADYVALGDRESDSFAPGSIRRCGER